MSTEFHLFRAKFIRPSQIDLFHEETAPSVIFVKSVLARPAAQFRRDYTWHIGNVNFLGKDQQRGYFAIGRDSPTPTPKRDPATGDFIKTIDETSPHTYAVFDAFIGLLALEKESDLAPETDDIARKIERLLSSTEVIRRNEITVKIDPIPDPADFLQKIASCNAVKKFTASFTGPNPFDADELFQKPLSVYLKAAEGDHGTTSIEGARLAKDVVAAVARSTAATGNTASARVQEIKGSRPIRINLTGDPVKIHYEDEAVPKEIVIEDAVGIYRKIRHE